VIGVAMKYMKMKNTMKLITRMYADIALKIAKELLGFKLNFTKATTYGGKLKPKQYYLL